MCAMSWLKRSMLLPALCLAAMPVLAQQQDPGQQASGDPVADAARKTREQQKKEAKPKKVYTEDDISRGKGNASEQSAGSTGQQGAADSGQGAGAGTDSASACLLYTSPSPRD